MIERVGWMLTALLLAAAVSGQEPLSLEQLRAQRRELAHRPRGIIANNDGCDVLYFPADRELTVPAFLDARTTELADTQVGAIAYCTISSGFSFFTHNTQAGTLLTRQSADYGIQTDKRNVSQELIELGTDCLQAVVDYAHAHDMEAWWSMRMNDTHDVAHRPDKPYLLYPPLKVEHPEWLVGDPVKRTPYGRWSSVDYAVPEIRDLAFEYIAEVCRNYDVDGVELDFFRHLCYFKSTANGQAATDAERAAMTELMRRVRAMTEDEGRRRGRPILVSMRVPDSVGFSRDLGLDIETWLAEGLVDLLVTTGYFRLNPWTESVALGHRYDVPVYPCLSDSRVRNESRFRRGSIESLRGRAMNAWAAGADGIHTFNAFNPRSPIFRELGDPDALATMDKLYFVTVRDGNPASWLAGGDRYRSTPLLVPLNPRAVTPSRPFEVPLMVGEAIGRTAVPAVTLHLDMPGVTDPARLRVSLNGHALPTGTAVGDWVDIPVDPAVLVRGENRLGVAIEPGPATDDTWPLVWQAGGAPAAPWSRDRGSERTEAVEEDGALRIADRGEESGDYLYYRYAWGADPAEKTVAEAEAKVVAGSSYLIVDNGVGSERLGLWPDRIELWSNPKLRYAMDTTDAFHTYRVEIDGQDLRVYVDGELRIEAPGQFVDRDRPVNALAFGAANSPQTGEALWRSVRARPLNPTCRDGVLSVNYE